MKHQDDEEKRTCGNCNAIFQDKHCDWHGTETKPESEGCKDHEFNDFDMKPTAAKIINLMI